MPLLLTIAHHLTRVRCLGATQMETRLYQLLAQVRQIANEQAYQRSREATFRAISESTNVRVLWWSIAQAAILIIIAALQLRHLRGFFEAKKLV